MQSFTKYGISLKGRSVSQLTKGENEKEERIRGHLGRLEKIIQEKAIDLYTLFYKGKKSENQ